MIYIKRLLILLITTLALSASIFVLHFTSGEYSKTVINEITQKKLNDESMNDFGNLVAKAFNEDFPDLPKLNYLTVSEVYSKNEYALVFIDFSKLENKNLSSLPLVGNGSQNFLSVAPNLIIIDSQIAKEITQIAFFQSINIFNAIDKKNEDGFSLQSNMATPNAPENAIGRLETIRRFSANSPETELEDYLFEDSKVNALAELLSSSFYPLLLHEYGHLSEEEDNSNFEQKTKSKHEEEKADNFAILHMNTYLTTNVEQLDEQNYYFIRKRQAPFLMLMTANYLQEIDYQKVFGEMQGVRAPANLYRVFYHMDQFADDPLKQNPGELSFNCYAKPFYKFVWNDSIEFSQNTFLPLISKENFVGSSNRLNNFKRGKHSSLIERGSAFKQALMETSFTQAPEEKLTYETARAIYGTLFYDISKAEFTLAIKESDFERMTAATGLSYALQFYFNGELSEVEIENLPVSALSNFPRNDRVRDPRFETVGPWIEKSVINCPTDKCILMESPLGSTLEFAIQNDEIIYARFKSKFYLNNDDIPKKMRSFFDAASFYTLITGELHNKHYSEIPTVPFMNMMSSIAKCGAGSIREETAYGVVFGNSSGFEENMFFTLELIGKTLKPIQGTIDIYNEDLKVFIK